MSLETIQHNGKTGIFIEQDTTEYFVLKTQQQLVEENNTRELGKYYQCSNEFIQGYWINKHTSLNVKRREEIDESLLVKDNNGSGFDLFDLKSRLTIQSKFRGATLFLEVTRRKSKKNIDKTVNGNVRYELGEADIYLFTIPNGRYDDHNHWEYLAIPQRFLEDPKRPGLLIGNVNKKLIKQFEGRAVEILEQEYKNKLGLQ
jgi:hypothetical protein